MLFFDSTRELLKKYRSGNSAGSADQNRGQLECEIDERLQQLEYCLGKAHQAEASAHYWDAQMSRIGEAARKLKREGASTDSP